MPYPHLKFRQSALRDFKTLCAFAGDAKYDNGRNLDWAIFAKYPQLKQNFDKNYKINNKKTLRQFINSQYHSNEKKFEKALTQHKKRWEKIAPQYFSLVDKLFNSQHWPKGKYISFGTIWSMYPRFLEDKTFQIPYQHRNPKYVPVIIAHELLHFMFYDYFYKQYPKYNRQKYNFLVWHISETFNTLVQNSPEWLKYFKVKSEGYPEHQELIAKLSRIFSKQKNWDLNELVAKITDEVLSQKIAG